MCVRLTDKTIERQTQKEAHRETKRGWVSVTQSIGNIQGRDKERQTDRQRGINTGTETGKV